jgi:nitrate reductase NapD
MHYSSILVTTRPDDMPGCLEVLQTLPGVQVHLRYPEEGRIIVTQETPSLAGQEDGLRRIQGVPRVLTAALVYHYVDGGAEAAHEPSPAAGPAASGVIEGE